MNAQYKLRVPKADLVVADDCLLAIADEGGRNTYVNNNAALYFGVSKRRLLGDNWILHLHQDDRLIAAYAWIDAVNAGKAYHGVFRYRKYDDTYNWFKVSGILKQNEQTNDRYWAIFSTPLVCGPIERGST